MSTGSGVTASALSFSFRPPEPPRPAAELLAEIRARGGRVYRYRAVKVLCLTDSPETAEWLLGLGAGPTSSTPSLSNQPPGAFYRSRAKDKVEWELWISPIPVEGDLWEAAA